MPFAGLNSFPVSSVAGLLSMSESSSVLQSATQALWSYFENFNYYAETLMKWPDVIQLVQIESPPEQVHAYWRIIQKNL